MRFGSEPRSLTTLSVLAVITASACSSEEAGPIGPPPTLPPTEIVGDIVAGQQAFLAACTECHTTRDGFDLAHFRFPPRDVIRRALGHVDSTTALDIAAYIESLSVRQSTPRVAAFQPGGKIARTDMDFWTAALGTEYWPADLTPQALRAIDPRDIPIPLAFAQWSHEASDEDWLPDQPLPARLLNSGQGEIPASIAAYHADPTEGNLVTVLEIFDAVSKSPSGICTEMDPDRCFNARRWMSSLAAQHYLRVGEPESVPVAVAQVWWDVGESAIQQQTVARTAEDRARAFRNGGRWMYLGYSYAPEAFEEPAGYMGTFLISQDLYRVATFAALRRMVGNGRAHQRNPIQYLHDGTLAAQRAPGEVTLGVTEFTLEHFVDRIQSDGPPPTDHLRQARFLVTEVWQASRGSMWRDQLAAARINQLRDQVLQLLQ